MRAALLALPMLACTPSASSLAPPSQAAWTAARAELSALRATEPTGPHVENVRVSMHEPRSGRTVQARGAVAVDPHKAMRMVLIGPGGATALDVWVTLDRWRFAVPALGVLRRGGIDSAASERLPIGFFRWWFLGPLDGRLLTAHERGASATLVLRQGEATVTLTSDRERTFRATRREAGNVERLAWEGAGLRAAAGDRAVYEQESTGVRVEVTVESTSTDAPDPAAFTDPDAQGGTR